MRRSLPHLGAPLAVALVLVLAGCSSGPIAPAAARIGTTTITRTELDDQLEVLAENTGWLKENAAYLDLDTLGAPNGNVTTTFTAAWLTALMNQVIIDRAFERRNLTVTEQNREDALTAAKTLFNTDAGSTWETLPKWFRDDFLAGQARYEAVSADLPPNRATNTQLEGFGESSRPQYCPVGDALSHIVVETQAEADAIAAELAQGVPFEDLLPRSAQPGSSGFIGCIGSPPTWEQLPEALRQAAEALPVGTTSAPVQSDVGFHILRVTPYDAASLRDFFEAAYLSTLRPPIDQYINSRLLEAKIWVDPRYGTLNRGPVRVNPPEAPTPRDEPRRTEPAGAPGP